MNTIEKENHVRSQGNKEFQKQMNLNFIYPKYKPLQQSSPIPQEIAKTKQSPLTSSVQAIPQLIPQSQKQQQSGIVKQQQSPIKQQLQAQQNQQQQQQQTQQQPQKRIRILEVKDMY
ncbi:unnamed protein product [Paramecium octaurelia]|uniref:Uncharacterized protein n=1 Tax=Paramecium octaurelia TaxID=43137 RepID=A0A8S1VV41_PAROT|nr:unnamed protein product [Paramecium octaurelia]